MPFAKARFILLAHDWKPVAVDIESKQIGVENQLTKKKYSKLNPVQLINLFAFLTTKKLLPASATRYRLQRRSALQFPFHQTPPMTE
jgi:hypothetical protein